MLKTSGPGGGPNDAQNFLSQTPVARVLLDIREYGFNTLANLVAAGQVISRIGSGGVSASENAANGISFWGRNPASLATMYPLANQLRVGNTLSQPRPLAGSIFSSNYVSSMAGLDQFSDPVGTAQATVWQIHELEVLVGKTTNAGALIVGFGNNGGGTGDPFNTGSIGGLAYGAIADDAGHTFGRLILRNDVNGGPILFVGFPKVYECVAQAARIMFRQIWGPRTKTQLWINGELVLELNAASFQWKNLNNLSGTEELQLVPHIWTYAPITQWAGPYYSRATIYELPTAQVP